MCLGPRRESTQQRLGEGSGIEAALVAVGPGAEVAEGHGHALGQGFEVAVSAKAVIYRYEKIGFCVPDSTSVLSSVASCRSPPAVLSMMTRVFSSVRAGSSWKSPAMVTELLVPPVMVNSTEIKNSFGTVLPLKTMVFQAFCAIDVDGINNESMAGVNCGT